MNIKRITAVVMAVCVIGAIMPSIGGKTADNAVITANAYTEGTYEQLNYKKYGDYIEISDCDESATSVVIPAEIDGVPVTIIGDSAFKNCTSLTEIKIPSGVTSIGNGAFIGCSKLESITIPESVTSIGYGAFVDCSYLDPITILNPDCNISDSAWTFACNAYLGDDGQYHILGFMGNYTFYYGTIYGYDNSTAQAYVEKYKEYSYKFKSLGKAPEKAAGAGDVNGDGKVDSSDASLVLAEYAQLSTGKNSVLSETAAKLADLNKDGKIDSSDASMILAYYSHVSTGGKDSIEDFLAKQGN